MIDKAYGSYFLTCDICLNSAEEKFDNFDDAVDYKKSNGWRSEKKYGEWLDICPECHFEKFEMELVDKQVQKIREAKKECQSHYGKQLGCGTCKALQLCTMKNGAHLQNKFYTFQLKMTLF
jgi:hypothetical protein